MTARPFRILESQATGAKAKQALMIGSTELRLFTYRGGYQLADPEQQAALEHTLTEEFGARIPMPELDGGATSHVYYLIVLADEPLLIPEEDVVAIVFGIVLAISGVEAARRVSYRAHMLPESTQ